MSSNILKRKLEDSASLESSRASVKRICLSFEGVPIFPSVVVEDDKTSEEEHDILTNVASEWPYDDNVNEFDDWVDTASEFSSVNSINEPSSPLSVPIDTKKRVSWAEEIEIPRYFLRDDCPRAAQQDAVQPFQFLDFDEEDMFGQQYLDAMDDLILSCQSSLPL